MSKPLQKNNLLDVFVSKVPRERAGARSSNRFTYQQSWALCLLLELEKSQSDYLIIFDYHDDIVVFNSETLPSEVSFFQVKTRNSDWTLTDLLQRNKKSKKSLSVLGKMYANNFIFPEYEPTITLVSSAKYKVKLHTNPKNEVLIDSTCLSGLCKEAITKISSSLQLEHDLDYSPLVFDNIFLDAANISDDHINHSLGRLAAFLEELDPNGNYSAPAAHRAIRGTIQIKNNCEDAVSSTNELKRKSISKSDFGKILKRIMSVPKKGTGWETIKQFLIKEGVDVFKILDYENAWEKHEVESMDPTNTVLMSLVEIVRENIAQKQIAATLTEYIAALSKSITSSKKYAALPMKPNEEYLAAVILMERYEQSKL